MNNYFSGLRSFQFANKDGQLNVIAGPMVSGKTTNLISLAKKELGQGNGIAIFKSSIDHVVKPVIHRNCFVIHNQLLFFITKMAANEII